MLPTKPITRASALMFAPTLISILASVIIAQARMLMHFPQNRTMVIVTSVVNVISVALMIVSVGLGAKDSSTRLRHVGLLISLLLPILGLLCIWFNLIPPVAWRSIGYFEENLMTVLPVQIGATIGAVLLSNYYRPATVASQ